MKMAEVMTFINLLKKYEICIPIIQRDYAQGRNNEKTNEVRKNLIRDIKKCLEDENKKIDFNFVYGTISDNVFYPVDGQQRLTSLYLLHWYINQILDPDKMSNMKNFSYMTRNSASDFFSLLRNPNTELKSIIKKDSNIKAIIMNQSWFQVEWKLDPTVDAALNFLNDLSNDRDFKEKAIKFFERLEKGAIEFSFIIEQGEHAEINAAKSYIRMNARGKKLNSFENLKAMIDSLENKVKPENSFVEAYDNCYIDILYSQSNKDDKLEEKTNKINQKSLCFLKNLYNLCCQLQKCYECYEMVADDNQFISTIYDISQSILNKNQTLFFLKYLDIAKTIFDYYCNNNNEKIIINTFQDKGEFIASDNRETIATILYIYNSNKNDIERNNEDIEKYLYILKNLNFCEWKEELFLKKIVAFSEEISEKENVHLYFNETDLSQINNILVDVLDDIKVRIKEQKIKSTIILDNKYKFYYFDDLEKRSPYRKIQYILWLSGFWSNNNPNLEDLNKYMACANDYFYNNNIKWRKLFAIASNIDENNELKSCDEINTNCAYTKVWDDVFYYWNDSVEDDEDDHKPNDLKLIKNAYDICDKFDEIIEKLNKDNYKKCWFRYAVNNNNPELLEQNLIWDEDKVKLSNKTRYDMYVMHVTKGALYGLMSLEKSAKAEYRFEANLNHSDRLTTGNRAFVMKLYHPVQITGINDNRNMDNCMYSWDDSNKIYTIFQFNNNEEYCYEELIYKIEEKMKELDNMINTLQDILKNYNKDDFLNVFSNNHTKATSYKRYNKTSRWNADLKTIAYDKEPTIQPRTLDNFQD